MKLRELLIERYAVLHNLKDRTIELQAGSIDKFALFLGREPEVSDLNDLTISKFCRWRATTKWRGRTVSAATVKKDLTHLTGLWNFCARKRMKNAEGEMLEFPDLPRNLLRVPQKVPRGYKVEEVSAMIRAAKDRCGRVGPVEGAWFWQTIIMAAWYTGARIGSLQGVRWGDVDLEAGRIVFRAEEYKGGLKSIVRAIPADLVARLRTGVRAEGELVWPWRDYRRGATSIFQALRFICHSAGVTPRGFHAIRKASGSYVKAGGGDATDHLAHENPRTTRQSYLDPTITGQQSALDYLPPLDLGE
jgi:integrase